MAKKNIGVTLSLKDGGFTVGIKKSVSGLGDFKKGSEKAASACKSFGSGMKSATGNIGSMINGLVGVAAAYAGVRKIVDVSKECISAYSEQEAAVKRLETTILNVPGNTKEGLKAITDFASELQKTSTVGDEVAIKGASQLGTFQLQTDTIKTLMPALNDLAVSQYGVAVSGDQMQSIANLLGKVMTGNVSSLTKYGVTMDDNQKKILKNGTESEKAAMLVKVLGQNFGRLAESMASTPEGRIQQMKNAWGDMQEVIGGQLFPIVTDFLTFVNSKLPSIQNVLTGVVGWIMPKVKRVMDFVTSAVETLSPLVQNVAQKYIIPTVSRISSFVSTATGKLIPIIRDVAQKYILPAISKVMTFFSGAMQKAKDAIDKNKGNFMKIGEMFKAIGRVFKLVWNGIKPVFSFIANTAIPGIITIMAKLIPVITNIFNFIADTVPIVKNVFTVIVQKVSAFLTPVVNAFKSAWELICVVWGYVKPYFETIWNGIKAVFSVVKTVLGGYFTVAWDIIKGVWSGYVFSDYMEHGSRHILCGKERADRKLLRSLERHQGHIFGSR